MAATRDIFFKSLNFAQLKACLESPGRPATSFAGFENHALEGLTDRSHRPYRQARQLPEALEAEIVRLKREYPHWGAPKIRERLRRRFPDLLRCPAISTVHAVLDRRGLVKRRRRRRSRDGYAAVATVATECAVVR